jgi:hypothetical protein
MTIPYFLPIRPKVGLPMQVSKWLSCPMLIDEKEMIDLLDHIQPFEIFIASGIMMHGEGMITKDEFLDCYCHYIQSLRLGIVPNDPRMHKYFSAIFTRSREALYAVHIDEKRQMIKVDQPVVQLQLHRISIGADKKFRSMGLGQNNIYWGIQFSYPQLYQNAAMQVITIRDSDEFPNSDLFKTLQKWTRNHTVATPFLVDRQRVNVPFRLGKACFEWINHHPQLKDAGLQVITE